ncbi:MAG: penicillin acylase family protein, partial [Acidimicrobiia bacterium]|nr:penicillin acylase family protein [Acidimicrobiia bacterium]
AADPGGAPAADPAGDAMRRWAEEVRGLPSFAQLFDPARRGDTGSNEWGVAGSVTPSGRPIIANDPHLSLDLPSTFYPIGLRSPSMSVTGIGFAGAPTVILGQNRDITWGATTNPLDVTDSYQEQVVDDPASPSGISTVYEGRNEPVVEIPEVYRANTRGNGTLDDIGVVAPGTPVEGSDLGPVPESTFVVPRRNNGPLLLRTFSIQYTGFSGTRELETFLRWDRASNLDDFREGLEFFDVGSQNWAYADRDGNLGYFSSAEAPLREDLEAGAVVGNPPWLLRDGTGGNEWLPDPDPGPNQAVPYQVLPYEEMPQVLNPDEGFFVNANNDPAGTTLDNDPLNQRRPSGGIYYLNNGYDGYRGGRITERIRAELAGDGTVSRRDMRDIQADVALPDASFFLPYLTGAYDRSLGSETPELVALAGDERVAEAIERLRGWDTTAPTGVPEGYDAGDEGGTLSDPTDEEIATSVAATIYSVWRGQFIAGSIDASLEAVGVSPPGDDQAIAGLRNLLESFDQNQGIGVSGVDLFASATSTTPEDRRDEVILGALSGALDLLSGEGFAPAFGGSTDQDDYRWGRLHRVTFDHPLGGDRSAPPAGGFATVEGLDGIATDGGFNTVDASGHNGRADEFDDFRFGGGPVRRFTGIGGPQGIRGETSLPGGASGLVESD